MRHFCACASLTAAIQRRVLADGLWDPDLPRRQPAEPRGSHSSCQCSLTPVIFFLLQRALGFTPNTESETQTFSPSAAPSPSIAAPKEPLKRGGLFASGKCARFPVFCLPLALLLPLLGQVADASPGSWSSLAPGVWGLNYTFVPILALLRMAVGAFLMSCRPAPSVFVSFSALN